MTVKASIVQYSFPQNERERKLPEAGNNGNEKNILSETSSRLVLSLYINIKTTNEKNTERNLHALKKRMRVQNQSLPSGSHWIVFIELNSCRKAKSFLQFWNLNVSLRGKWFKFEFFPHLNSYIKLQLQKYWPYWYTSMRSAVLICIQWS